MWGLPEVQIQEQINTRINQSNSKNAQTYIQQYMTTCMYMYIA